MLKRDAFFKRKYRKLFMASLLGWVISIVGEMADSVLSGLLVSSEAVAAVELVLPLGSLSYALSLPVAVGASVVYSRYAGAFEKEKAYKAAFEGLAASILIGLIMAVAMIFCKDAYLDFYGASDVVRDYASEYYNAYMSIALIEPVFWFIYNLILTDGDEGLTLAVDIGMTVINAVGSYVLGSILGVEGLAIGTLVSYLTIIILLFHFRKKNNSIHFRKAFRMRELGEMAALGSASAMSTVYLAIVDIVMNRFIIARFGDNFLPAYAVVNIVMNLAAVLLCAVDGGRPFVTVGYGEKNNYTVGRVMKNVAVTASATSVVITAFFQILAPYWSPLYGITSPDVAQAAEFAGRIIPLTYLAAAFVYIFQCYYPVVGEVILGHVFGIAYMLVGPIVIAIPLAFLGGFNGMTVGFALTPVFALLAGAAAALIARKGRKFPLLLPATDETGTSFDILLSSENISELCEKIRDCLSGQGVEDSVMNQVQLIAEETFMHVIEMNPGKKVTADATILVSPEKVRLVTRDDGIIFNITDADAEIGNLRCYVLSQLLIHTDERSYATTISFNRNMYIWERRHALHEAE